MDATSELRTLRERVEALEDRVQHRRDGSEALRALLAQPAVSGAPAFPAYVANAAGGGQPPYLVDVGPDDVTGAAKQVALLVDGKWVVMGGGCCGPPSPCSGSCETLFGWFSAYVLKQDTGTSTVYGSFLNVRSYDGFSDGSASFAGVTGLDLIFALYLDYPVFLNVQSPSLGCDPDLGWTLTLTYSGQYSDGDQHPDHVTTVSAGFTAVFALTKRDSSVPAFDLGALISRNGSYSYHIWNTSAGGYQSGTGDIDWTQPWFGQVNDAGVSVPATTMENLPVPYALTSFDFHCATINCTVHIDLQILGCAGLPLQCGAAVVVHWFYLSDPGTVWSKGADSYTDNNYNFDIGFTADDPATFSADVGYYFEVDFGGNGMADVTSVPDPDRYFQGTAVACGETLTNCVAVTGAPGSTNCISDGLDGSWTCALGFNMPLPKTVYLQTRYGEVTLQAPDYTSCATYLDSASRDRDPTTGALSDAGLPVAVLYQLRNVGGSLAVRKAAYVFCDDANGVGYLAQETTCSGGDVQPDPMAAATRMEATVLVTGTGNNMSGSMACGPISGTALMPVTGAQACPAYHVNGFDETITVLGGQPSGNP